MDDIWDQIDNLLETRNESKHFEEKPLVKMNTNVNIHICITREGTYIKNTEELPHKVIKRIQKYFTISNKNIMGYFDHTSAWYYKKNILYIPRFGSFSLSKIFDNITWDNKIRSKNSVPNIKCNVEFSGNQEIIFDKIMNTQFSSENVKNGRAGLILNLQAGHGKTFLALYLIGILKCRTLVVTHNSSILDQWVELIKKYLPDSSCGQYYGKKKIPGDITVGVINSLVMDEIYKAPPEEFYNEFDFVILDEVHEYCSKTRRKIYKIANPTYMLGLSATPDERTDSLDKINHWGCGDILVASAIPGYTIKNIPFKGCVTSVYYSGPEIYTKQIIIEKTELTSTPLMIGQLCEDPYRLNMIISLILECHDKKLNTLVLADRRKYLEDIRLKLEELKQDSFILTEKSELDQLAPIRLVGGSTAAEFDEAKLSKNIILSTFQFMGTGCSIPKLNALVLATPRKTKGIQFVNRIFRLGSNYKIERQIFDIIDTRTSLKSQWYERRKYYDEQRFEIKKRKISFEEFAANL